MNIEFALFAAVGFFAQLVDGALGMAFGVIASTSLIAAGAPPAIASAAVHTAEIATTGLSARRISGTAMWTVRSSSGSS